MFFLLVLLVALDGELVLRNKTIVAYQGEYEIKGNTVRFTSKDGKPMVLPKKLVDFEQTAARRKAREVQAAKRKAQPKKKKRKVVQSVADLVGDDGIRTDVSVAGDELKQYAEESPGTTDPRYQQQTGSSSYYDRNLTPRQQKLRRGFVKEYKDLHSELRKINSEMNNTWREKHELQRNKDAAAMSDAADARLKVRGPALDKKIAELQDKRRDIYADLDNLRARAEAEGITHYYW